MPRPYKIGLDYFPLDVDFFTNKKIKNLKRVHDVWGIPTYIAIMCRVFHAGYYYKFDDLEELSMDIAEDIAYSQLRKTATNVTKIINYLVERGILDEGLFKKGIISGVAFQEQYVISTYKAKRNIKMDVHCLVDVNEVIEKNKVNSEETQVNSEETQVDSENGTQSKVNKNNINNKCFTTTTTDAQARAIPSDLEIIEYFSTKLTEDLAGIEALRWKRTNAESYGWSCLPDWKSAADRWIDRIK